MPSPTPELGLQKALDADDTADYLDTALANSLTTIDSLFSNTSGHTHGGVHQGAPIGSIPASAIPDGSITSAKIQDGTIQGYDFADGAVTNPKLAANAVTTDKIADGTIQGADIAGNTITSDKIATFSSGPFTTDWFRNNTINQGIFNTPANQGIAFDASGAYAYPSSDRLVTATAPQTLVNKTLVNPTAISGATLTSCTINSSTTNSQTDNSPTINNPTLAGTVAGAPAWSSVQNFAAGTQVGGRRILGQQVNGSDWRIDYGVSNTFTVANGGSPNQSVSFHTAFSTTPFILATLNTATGSTGQITSYNTVVHNQSASGFQVDFSNASGSNQSMSCSWVAIGQ